MTMRLKQVGLFFLIALTLMSFAPVLSLMLSIFTAHALGCTVDEGAVHVCLVAGIDVGRELSAGAMMGWLMVLTWPGMLICLAAWPLLLILWIADRRGNAIANKPGG